MDYYKKKYDEALERARKLKENPQSVFNEYSPKEGDTICDYIFPELKESEDEKIRKELIDIVAKSPITFAFEDKNKVLSWLEKQGGQKPVWGEEDERNFNDAILFIETGTYSLDKDNLINWLKSLKQRIGDKL